MFYPFLLVIINIVSCCLHLRYDASSLYIQFIPSYPLGLIAYLGGFPGAFAAKTVKAIKGRETVNVPALLMTFAASVPYVWSAVSFTAGGIDRFPFFPVEMHILANLAAAFVIVPALLEIRSAQRSRDRGMTPNSGAMLIAEDECEFTALRSVPADMLPARIETYCRGYGDERGIRFEIVHGLTDKGIPCLVIRHPELRCRMTVIRCSERNDAEGSLYRYAYAVIGDTLYGDPAGDDSVRSMHLKRLKHARRTRNAKAICTEWYRSYNMFIRSMIYALKLRSMSTAADADAAWKREKRWYNAIDDMITKIR